MYPTKMVMLWWKQKDARNICTINTWEQFKAEFKKTFYPNNVVYEAKRRLRELKQKGSMKAYIKEFTTLTIQIPNLTEERYVVQLHRRVAELGQDGVGATTSFHL